MVHDTRGQPACLSDGESMDPERWQRACAIFAAALRCAPADREVLLGKPMRFTRENIDQYNF